MRRLLPGLRPAWGRHPPDHRSPGCSGCPKGKRRRRCCVIYCSPSLHEQTRYFTQMLKWTESICRNIRWEISHVDKWSFADSCKAGTSWWQKLQQEQMFSLLLFTIFSAHEGQRVFTARVRREEKEKRDFNNFPFDLSKVRNTKRRSFSSEHKIKMNQHRKKSKLNFIFYIFSTKDSVSFKLLIKD